MAFTALAYAQMTPSVTVSDQEIADGTVTVDAVVSEGPGWIVIHADQDGAPGPVLGYTAVSDGENSAVAVELAAEGRTETLYAMLHTDAGTVGTYEFPGDDGPVSVDDQVVVVPFTATEAMMAEEEMMAEEMVPSVTVSDQSLMDGAVTVDKVVSSGPGWIVIHADQDGAPGPVLGHTAVSDGENSAVVVELAAEGRTDTLYAMLHTDAGTVGTYEFPGDDGPVSVADQVVVVSFNTTAEEAMTLPETGGVIMPWAAILLLVAGGLILAAGSTLALAQRPR
jgi:hypothetical protein